MINGEPCPPAGPSLPARSGCATSAAGDFDGDGEDDRASVYAAVDDGLMPQSWRLRVLLDSGVRIDRAVDAGTRFSYPRALGSADVQGDGADELFVKVGDQLYHSGATRVLNMYVLDGDEVVPVTRGGAPLAIRVGGIWRFAEGAECRRGRLALLRDRVEEHLQHQVVVLRAVLRSRGLACEDRGAKGGRVRDPAVLRPAPGSVLRAELRGSQLRS